MLSVTFSELTFSTNQNRWVKLPSEVLYYFLRIYNPNLHRAKRSRKSMEGDRFLHPARICENRLKYQVSLLHKMAAEVRVASMITSHIH